MLKKLSFACLLWVAMLPVIAQPFAADIAAFKKHDSVYKPPANPVLFTGSSSFTKWTDVQDYFPGITILNRGFGGSTLLDLLRYENDVIFAYNPKQIVIYCGENDIASSDTVTGKMVFDRWRQLYTDIRSRYPTVPIIYVSMKPSPLRWHMRDRMIDGNDRIKRFIKRQKHTKFIDVWRAMLGPNARPMPELFIEDNLHMNAYGYDIWKELLAPHLLN